MNPVTEEYVDAVYHALRDGGARVVWSEVRDALTKAVNEMRSE